MEVFVSMPIASLANLVTREQFRFRTSSAAISNCENSLFFFIVALSLSVCTHVDEGARVSHCSRFIQIISLCPAHYQSCVVWPRKPYIIYSEKLKRC